jgi:hypothetical protein
MIRDILIAAAVGWIVSEATDVSPLGCHQAYAMGR